MSKQLYHYYRRRTLRRNAKQAISQRLPHFTIQAEALARPETLFDFCPRALCLEIGFGGGEYLLTQMRQDRDIGFIACEPYLNGVAKLARALEPATDRNIRIYRGDARDLFPHCRDALFDRIVLLYPDPWPKYRHHRRRFIQTATIDQLARLLKGEGEILAASDDPQLLAWMLAHFLADRRFCWKGHRAAQPPYLTRYEAKAAACGQKPVQLAFLRRSG